MFTALEFFQFLRRPYYITSERAKTNVLTTSIKIYLLTLLILGLINLLLRVILGVFLILPVDNTLNFNASMNGHLWYYFIAFVILSPIIEEVIFRLSLIFNPVYISFSVSTLTALIINRLSNYLVAILVFFLLFVLVRKLILTFKYHMFLFWRKNFKYIFYFLSILFGLVHISNYEFNNISQYLITPILILPQLGLGLILSFTRVFYEKGFLICLITHILINLISVSFSLIHFAH